MSNKPIVFDNSQESGHMKRERIISQKIKSDISIIDNILSCEDADEVRRIHRQIDGRYQACIDQWGMGMYGFHPQHGFAHDSLEIDSLKDNLELMKAKLESYELRLNAKDKNPEGQNEYNFVVNNNISIDITFAQARKAIEDMPGLKQDEVEEILGKIDELENISNQRIPRKKKWEMIHPILSFALDKSVDVAIMVLSLFLNMNI